MLRHVLQMSSGLDWVEDYEAGSPEQSDIIQQVVAETDQLAYAAGQPALHEPGTVFNYSSGDTMLLSGVLEQATGMSVAEYAEQELFGPLGIDQAEWWSDAEGNTLTYCCLDTTSRDFARFGQLYLNGGLWGDEQVVSADWVADSVEPAPTYDGYGYHWWLAASRHEVLPDDLYSANGHDGQYTYVIPSLDLVVVRNGIYVKDPGPPVADPNLFSHYPSDGLGVDRGTFPPEHGLGPRHLPHPHHRVDRGLRAGYSASTSGGSRFSVADGSFQSVPENPPPEYSACTSGGSRFCVADGSFQSVPENPPPEYSACTSGGSRFCVADGSFQSVPENPPPEYSACTSGGSRFSVADGSFQSVPAAGASIARRPSATRPRSAPGDRRAAGWAHPVAPACSGHRAASGTPGRA